MRRRSLGPWRASGLGPRERTSGQAEVDRLRSELASTEAAKQRLQAATFLKATAKAKRVLGLQCLRLMRPRRQKPGRRRALRIPGT